MISTLEMLNWQCARCTKSTPAPTWVAIDLAERPDLRLHLASESAFSVTCVHCGEQITRSAPLLVTRLAVAAPVLLGLNDDQLEIGDAPPEFKPVINQVRAALGPAGRDVPGPMLPVPFGVLQLAAVADVDADIQAGDTHPRHHTWTDPMANRYAHFLAVLHDVAHDRRVQWCINLLRDAEGATDLENLLYEFPELCSDDVRDALQNDVADGIDSEHIFIAQAWVDLRSRTCDGDFISAWKQHENATKVLWDKFLGPRIDELVEQIERGSDDRDWQGVITAAQALLDLNPPTGAEPLEILAATHLAAALYEIEGSERGERLERIIQLLTRVLQLADAANLEDPVARANVLMNLGAAWAARLAGDPVANQLQAISCNNDALALTSLEVDGHGWALAQTNLSLSLLELAEQLPGGDPSDDGANTQHPRALACITEAIERLNSALTWRSFDRDPLDWAFTQLNLGLAYSRQLAGDRRTNLSNSVEHYANAAAGFASANSNFLEGQALQNLATATFELAELQRETPEMREQVLEAAAAYAEDSLAKRSLVTSPLEAGRTWRQYGTILYAQGDHAGAIRAYEQALVGLTPTSAPRDCRDAARALAIIHAELEDWRLAADAWELAAQAAANALRARFTSIGHRRELADSLNVFRFAAYTLARVGRLHRAVEILELGRARELASILQSGVLDHDLLRDFNPELLEQFLEVQSQLDLIEVSERMQPGSLVAERASVSERLAGVTAAVRMLPGFEHFLEDPTFERIAESPAAGEALAYIVTSPHGSVVLIVHRTASHDSHVASFAAPVTSTEVARIFIDVDADLGHPEGYFIAHRDLHEDALDAALTRFGALLGADVLQPLVEYMRSADLRAVCFVPVGLLGLLPLQALEWTWHQQRCCVIDHVDALFAPSALAHSTCRARAGSIDMTDCRAVVIGNPMPHPSPLHGAEFEAAMIVEILDGSAACRLLTRDDATKWAVLDALPRAHLVHLACHAHAGIFDEPESAFLSFARDERILMHEIQELADFSPRLVVLSACETGVVQGYEGADENFALSTVFVAAGAASVIASLWAVEDFATAMLMSKFYETIFQDLPRRSRSTSGRSGSLEIASGLRRAQLWLRDLTEDGEIAYLDEHPALRSQRRASRRRRGLPEDASDDRPFARPNLWAAFILTGA